MSPLAKRDGNVYVLVADMGLDNSAKTVKLLLKTISDQVQPNVISKVMVK